MMVLVMIMNDYDKTVFASQGCWRLEVDKEKLDALKRASPNVTPHVFVVNAHKGNKHRCFAVKNAVLIYCTVPHSIL
jgi:hypothetical protein